VSVKLIKRGQGCRKKNKYMDKGEHDLGMKEHAAMSWKRQGWGKGNLRRIGRAVIRPQGQQGQARDQYLHGK